VHETVKKNKNIACYSQYITITGGAGERRALWAPLERKSKAFIGYL